MKKLIGILILAAGHLFVSLTAFFSSFAAGMSRFETGAPSSSLESALETLSAVLLFPVFPLAATILPKAAAFPFQYIPFLLNSLLWGACLYFSASGLVRRRKHNREELSAP